MGEHPGAGRHESSSSQASEPAPPVRRYGRRALMLGAAGAGAGITAALVAGPEAAQAADGNPVLIGESNSARATTSVNTVIGTGLQGSTTQGGQSGVAGIDEHCL